MENGRFKLNGESIVIDDNGNVIDGQHRLLAVVQSGATIRSVVVRGVDADSFQSIDSGVRRDGRDILSVVGYQYAKPLAATLNVLNSFYSNEGFRANPNLSAGAWNKIRKNDYIALAKKYEDCMPGVAYVHNTASRVRAFRPESFAAAMHYIFGKEGNTQARDAFFDSIRDGLPVYGAACPTLKLTKTYQVEKEVRAMNGSAPYRYEAWRKAGDSFKSKHEQANRKAASSLRLTTVNGVRFPEPI
jgi:hypothetical protein